MLRRLYASTLALSRRPDAARWLALISFVESSFFPIPPHAMLVPMCLARRDRAFYFALVCTLASVTGGWLGYAIGHFLYEEIGAPLVKAYGYTALFKEYAGIFNRYGAEIILVKGATPIPFKLLTITSGVTGLNFMTFTLASLASRGFQFFLVAGLIWKFGAPVEAFIEKRLEWVMIAFVVALVGGFLVLKYV